jgi:hypothetical protein
MANYISRNVLFRRRTFDRVIEPVLSDLQTFGKLQEIAFLVFAFERC